MAMSGGQERAREGKKASGPSGPGGRDGGMRDVAGANNRPGGYAAGGSVGGGFQGDRGPNALDRLLGHTSVDDRVARYNNNMARRQGGVTVPNIPNPSIGQILGSGFTSALMPGMAGILSTVGSNVYSGMNNKYGPYGMMGQSIDKALGGTPGEIQGTANVGRINDQGDPGPNRLLEQALYQTAQQNPMSLQPQGPQQPQTSQPGGVLSQPYPGAQVPIGGPSPYSYFRPNYNYWTR